MTTDLERLNAIHDSLSEHLKAVLAELERIEAEIDQTKQ